MTLPGKTASVWVDTSDQSRRYSALDGDLEVDVCVVGGGIAGLTAAYLLKKAGRSVAVLENRHIGRQVTGRSTAKITSLHSLIYADLIERIGMDKARLYAEANQTALAWIQDLVRDLSIPCGLESAAAYTFTEEDGRLPDLEREMEAARRLGLPASLTRDVPLPWEVAGAVRFDGQAQFNPYAYLAGLAATVDGNGSYVFEETRATAVHDGRPARVETEAGTVVADTVLVATNLPIITEGEFHKKTNPRSHLAVAAPIAQGEAPRGLFLSADNPSHSVRSAPWHNGKRLLVVIGTSYATGKIADQAALVRDLADWVSRRFPNAEPVQWHWANMDYDSLDRIPFVGRASREVESLYVATGFSSWGITNGTAAGLLLADMATGRPNPWNDLYDATREPGQAPNDGQPAMLRDEENRRPRPDRPESLSPGEAGVFRMGNDEVGVHRDPSGALHAVSVKCTHLGCTLAWNTASRNWECPCHGSVFSPAGKVLKGPAVRDLDVHPLRKAEAEPKKTDEKAP